MSVADLDRVVDLVADLSRIVCAALVIAVMLKPRVAIGPIVRVIELVRRRSGENSPPDRTGSPPDPPPV